ncbi:hypothetical protein ASD02_02420 [Ensifer sp. Root1252]|jgi:hypothetical protein|nr:hypothetical protein ASD00_00780 [Ensifer sp. Root31]KQW62986.1 hypothetical protein ASD02_02420 [Ensifer sp. Root1252]KQW85003.1 hypothetical protein ASD03_04615 [Ensifer sp. Root127]KQY71237.1 hypothetical protein ASD52_05970 [Ensifer sp. Root142]KRC83807.1 hypothetical protein ASE32_02410 [Ensifer sp. Root231]KRD04160.1 hypothetical protein ASE47_01070 [Ensifer sp. Root258]OMQ45193.1 hypothetical protein BKP54_09805 [Ensifer sp. 1H6]PSS66847.1 hypothetical protein C6558_02115 [Ensifer 
MILVRFMTFRILMNPCLFLSLNVLAACAALNVGSFEKLSGVDPLTSDPAELRVALLVPEALSLRRGDATLGISWKADGAPLDTHRFALQIQSGNVGAPGLTEGMREGQTLYVLTLTPADAERLRDMQEKIAATKGTEAKGRGSLTVGFSGGCWSGAFPADQKVTVDAWIRTRSDENYFQLLSGLDLMDMLRQSGVKALPACAA